jgi:hypothetical protein
MKFPLETSAKTSAIVNPHVHARNSAQQPYRRAVNLWASSWPIKPNPAVSKAIENVPTNLVGEKIAPAEKQNPITSQAIKRCFASTLPKIFMPRARNDGLAYLATGPPDLVEAEGDRAIIKFGQAWFSGSL